MPAFPHSREKHIGTIEVRHRQLIQGRRVLLLDDVYTSGATTEVCADVLIEAGARSVHTCVVGRTLRYLDPSLSNIGLQGVIFDLDQTLVDTRPVESLRSQKCWDDVRHAIPDLVPYDGMALLIQRLRQLGVETGIVSSAPKWYCERVIEDHDLLVDHVVAAHSSRKPKPEPDGVFAMLQQMGLSHAPDAVALVGDSRRDMMAAEAAGVWRYAAMWGGSACDADSGNVDQVCASPQDLMFELLHEISPE